MAGPPAPPATAENPSRNIYTSLPIPPGYKPSPHVTTPSRQPASNQPPETTSTNPTGPTPPTNPLQHTQKLLSELSRPAQPQPQPQTLVQKPRPFSPPRRESTILPPPPTPFFQSRAAPLPKLTLTPTASSKFSANAKSKSMKNSRTAFLTAALSPSFVSAKPLHTRTHTTISEVVGNLAPERYLSLPPRSTPAAKALLATAVCKELRDVQKLESIRTRHGDVEGGGWFDYVLDSLGTGEKLKPVVEKLKGLVLPQWDGIADRMGFLPLECLSTGSVMGQDLSEMVKKKGEHFRVSKTRAIESPEVRITRMRKAHAVEKAEKATMGVQGKSLLVHDPLDEDLLQPLPSRRTPFVPKPGMASTRKRVSSGEIFMVDDDIIEPPVPQVVPTRPRVQLPVFLVFDDATGQVSVDFEIRELPPKQTPHMKPATAIPTANPSQANTRTNGRISNGRKEPSVFERKAASQSIPNPNVEIQAAGEAPVASCARYGGPPRTIDTLLHELDDDMIAPEQNKSPESEPEVILVDKAKQTPTPKSIQRRTKRKRTGDRSKERIAETEQRASRMRSAVVSALQEDPEVRRQRTARTSAVNGHAKPKKKVSFGTRRTSRRTKKNVAPILDSSGSEKEYRRDEDDDFTIDTKDIIEVLPIPKANGDHARPPNLSPPVPRARAPLLNNRDPSDGLTEIESLDGSDMLSPPLRPSDVRAVKHPSRPLQKKASKSNSLQYARLHRNGASSSRHDAETHQGEPELWNREFLHVQRLIEESEQDSDPLLNQIEYNPYRFYEQVPILMRVIKAAKAQHGHLMDMDKVDEYDEMDQFYKETRNDPPFGSASCDIGTEFLEHVYHQTERARMESRSGFAGDPSSIPEDVNQEDKLIAQTPSKRTSDVVNLTTEEEHPSSPSARDSESSAESSGEEQEIPAGGSKRSRSQARSRASKARELQSRVCGDLLFTMTNESKRRVLRWAERDFTWFDRGVDVMEIVASRAYTRCLRCNTGEGVAANCEESILLKLWKDMSWRKVRRMRHRSSGAN